MSWDGTRVRYWTRASKRDRTTMDQGPRAGPHWSRYRLIADRDSALGLGRDLLACDQPFFLSDGMHLTARRASSPGANEDLIDARSL